jgi:hypothetical protein
LLWCNDRDLYSLNERASPRCRILPTSARQELSMTDRVGSGGA